MLEALNRTEVGNYYRIIRWIVDYEMVRGRRETRIPHNAVCTIRGVVTRSRREQPCLCGYLFNDTSIPRLLLARIYRSNVQRIGIGGKERKVAFVERRRGGEREGGQKLKWRVKLDRIIFSPE